MKLPEAPWQGRYGLPELVRVLGGGEGATRYVGGCVRDTLLGLDVNDVDFATRLTPGEVVDRLKAASIKSVPTGIAHGTVTAVSEGHPFEVTTLRRDVATDGRRATIAYTDDWQEDAARRDFTINALSADPVSLDIHDYFGGLADLEARCVRFIGDPLIRIAEDHLRILRFFRFHARFGAGEPEPAGLDACAARANDLMALSRERIADELLKLLGLPDPAPTVALMIKRGILRPVLPEIAVATELARLIRREDEAGIAPLPLRRLAALLPADAEVAATVAARLRVSKKAARRLVSAAGRRPGDDAQPRVLAYRIGTDEAVDRILLGDGPADCAARLDGWLPPRLPITGGQLIAMGLTPGPVVARTLREIEDEWIAAGFPDEQAVQSIAARHLTRAI